MFVCHCILANMEVKVEQEEELLSHVFSGFQRGQSGVDPDMG